MVYQNIEFHNVAELLPVPDGYAMARIPESLGRAMDAGERKKAYLYSTGIELRFRLKGERATVYLRVDEAAEAQTAYIYYGSFQGGWENSSRTILTQKTAITVNRPDNLEEMRKLGEQYGMAFQPDVVRLVLPYGTCYFLGVEGDIEAPAPADVPARTYLAYGSSITHGSLALAAPYSYPFRIARKLGCDYLNLGFAGSACLEKAVAEYLVSRKDWDFASVEMGINMIGDDFDLGCFEARVREFVHILAADGRPVFATDIFGYNGTGQEKAAQFRGIVEKYARGKLIFTEGLALLHDPTHISQDFTHPALEGIEDIVQNWSAVMESNLNFLNC